MFKISCFLGGRKTNFKLFFEYSKKQKKGLIYIEKLLFEITLILLITKTLGMLCKKINMPEVLGFILGGLVLGPMVLNLVEAGHEIEFLSEIGVILLMFLAGLETDIEEFKKTGIASTFIGVAGVIAPLILGYFGATFFFKEFWTCIFIGVILTATSVSITVQTLNELGKLNGKVGNTILGAAIIDDIVGLIIVSVVVSLSASANGGGDSSILAVATNIGLFILGAIVILIVVPKLIKKFNIDFSSNNIIPIILAFVFILAVLSEKLGIAAITGAFLAGLTLSSVKNKEHAEHKIETISSNFVSLVFFASIGLQANISGLNGTLVLIIAVMSLLAVVSKLIGCGLMAKVFKMSNRESIQIGSGMVSRGEVAIIVANIGLSKGIITQEIFVIMLAVTIMTTILAPILLKFAFQPGK